MKVLAVTTLLVIANCAIAAPDPLAQWPQWRGPLATGVAPQAKPPVFWAEDHNVRWKTPLPGIGVSTPIVWDDRIIVTASVPIGERLTSPAPSPGAHDNMAARHKHKFRVMAVNRRDGSVLWDRLAATEQPHETTHRSSSWASASPVTDGEHIVAFFGSAGVCGLTMAGELLWHKDLGNMQTKHGHGEGSSPALYGNRVIVNWDHEGDSFVVCLDKRTGDELWRRERIEPTSWSTPIVVVHNDRPQAIVSATNRVRAYDLETGDDVWACGGLSGNVVASPVAGDGYVYAGSSYEHQAMLGIPLATAKGDITGTRAVAWHRRAQTPYVPSPLLYGDELYFIRHIQGFITCLDAKSGRTHYGSQRLPGLRRIYASPVGAAGRVYVMGRGGLAYVLKRGPQFEVLARNQLDDVFSASPVPVGNELYLRGHDNLYCIVENNR